MMYLLYKLKIVSGETYTQVTGIIPPELLESDETTLYSVEDYRDAALQKVKERYPQAPEDDIEIELGSL